MQGVKEVCKRKEMSICTVLVLHLTRDKTVGIPT